ncbi:MAG: hypothetical protein FJ115_10765 [Deltaproteobacteria bacterium]|nr:hypothetical protein [Deltaproteobacteria bacterium]
MINQIKRLIKRVKRADVLAVLTLLFSSILFFYDLFGERYLLTERDLAPYFIPPRFFWVESLKQLDFPLWNPYQFSGAPFFANPQNGVLYPLNGLFFLLPFDIAFNSIILLHFFLAGLFTYLFMRDLKVSSTGSLVSGLVWMLGGYFLSVHSLLNILLSVVWTPLILLFFRRALIRPGIRNEVITAIFTTLSFLGGGIEVVYGNFFVLLFMIFLPVTSDQWAEEGQRRWKRIAFGIRSLLILSIAFIIFSAIQLLPFLELWLHSIRGEGISYHEATVWSFTPKDILLFFLPDAYGYFLDMKKYWITQCWLKTMYTGGLPFILSLIFFFIHYPGSFPNEKEGWVRKISGNRPFFLALMIFSLFLSLGKYNPLYPFVFKYVPFFNGIRYPVKFLYIFILALAVTAGLGFESLRQFSKEREGKTFKHLLMGFSLISGCTLLFLVLGHGQIEHFLKAREIDFPQFNHLSANLFHTKRFFFYLTLFFLLFRVGFEVRWKGWAKVSLIIFLIADLFGNMGFYGKEKTDDYFRKTKIVEAISLEKGPFRIFSTSKTINLDTPILLGNAVPFDLIKEKHLPSLNMIYHFHDIWGIDVVRLKKNDDLYRKFINLPSISSSHLVDVYGVKYVISVTSLEEDPRFELIYARLEGLEGEREELLRKETIKLYRVKKPSPKAQIVKDFKVMDPKEILPEMVDKDFQSGRKVLLEEVPQWNHQNSTPDSLTIGDEKKFVKFISETNNRLSLQVRTDEKSILVLSDTHYPGWKAFVDGREEKILRANYHFRAITLNNGSHRVDFMFDPISFKLGAGITLVGGALLLIGWVILRRNLWKIKGAQR